MHLVMHNYCLREAFKCEVMLSQRASFRRFVPLERFNSQPCIFLSFSLAPLFFFLKRKKYTDQVCTLHKSHRKPFSSSMFANYLNFNFICIPQWQLIDRNFHIHVFSLSFISISFSSLRATPWAWKWKIKCFIGQY